MLRSLPVQLRLPVENDSLSLSLVMVASYVPLYWPGFWPGVGLISTHSRNVSFSIVDREVSIFQSGSVISKLPLGEKKVGCPLFRSLFQAKENVPLLCWPL